MIYSVRSRGVRVVALAVVASCFSTSAASAGERAAAHGPPGLVLSTITTELPKTPRANVRVFQATFAPGYTSPWHSHPSPPFVYVVSGEATWEYRDGRKAMVRRAGQAAMEPTRAVLRLRNRGTAAMHLVLFQASRPGEPVMQPAR